MRIRDFIMLAVIFLWFVMVIYYLYKKKKSGRCIGCSGGDCSICKKSEKSFGKY